jgi:hypothetical protein
MVFFSENISKSSLKNNLNIHKEKKAQYIYDGVVANMSVTNRLKYARKIAKAIANCDDQNNKHDLENTLREVVFYKNTIKKHYAHKLTQNKNLSYTGHIIVRVCGMCIVENDGVVYSSDMESY